MKKFFGQKFYIILTGIILITSLFFVFKLVPAQASNQQELDEIQQQIKDQEAKIEELKQKETYYQETIATKRKEVISLQGQLSILEDSHQQILASIGQTEAEIKKTELEIVNTKLKIAEKEQEISADKDKIGEVLKTMYWADQQSLFEIILTNNSLSDFFNQIKFSEDLQSSIQNSLDKLTTAKQGLQIENDALNTKKEDLTSLQTALEDKENKLSEEEGIKSRLVTQTKGAEANFQSLLSKVRKEWQTASNEIASLENLAREKMRAQKESGQTLLTGNDLSWPVPSQYVTCEFHDPEYPYRTWIGEHPAIDVRAAQGTPIKAAAPGYVARAKDNGMGYSYIMLVHNDELSTVYGHVSQIYVTQDSYVTRGQVIGLSGGMPGTKGAGSFSSAPHLHFEVRSNGIPVNPLNYLQ
ncbi:MAG: peptidoglycan DD-metalloendopeptidase family protein [Patescibacteria group bacterium]